MAIEILSVDARLLSLFSGDATLITAFAALGVGSVKVFNERIPPGENGPLILISEYTNQDSNGVGGARVFNWAGYQVVVKAKNIGFFAIKPIVDRVDDILKASTGNSDGVNYIGGFIRQNVLHSAVPDNDDVWYTLGGVYSSMNHGV